LDGVEDRVGVLGESGLTINVLHAGSGAELDEGDAALGATYAHSQDHVAQAKARELEGVFH